MSTTLPTNVDHPSIANVSWNVSVILRDVIEVHEQDFDTPVCNPSYEDCLVISANPECVFASIKRRFDEGDFVKRGDDYVFFRKKDDTIISFTLHINPDDEGITGKGVTMKGKVLHCSYLSAIRILLNRLSSTMFSKDTHRHNIPSTIVRQHLHYIEKIEALKFRELWRLITGDTTPKDFFVLVSDGDRFILHNTINGVTSTITIECHLSCLSYFQTFTNVPTPKEIQQEDAEEQTVVNGSGSLWCSNVLSLLCVSEEYETTLSEVKKIIVARTSHLHVLSHLHGTSPFSSPDAIVSKERKILRGLISIMMETLPKEIKLEKMLYFLALEMNTPLE